MRRLARRLFMPCSVVSLLLCVAVCVLWVRSYWAWDGIVWASSPWKDDEVTYQQFASVRTLRGGLFTSRFRFDAMPEGFEEPQGLHVETVPVADVDLDHDIWGFSPWKVNVPSWHWTRERRNQRVVVPLWMVALVTLLTPSAWLWRHRRLRRRIRNGLCGHCGYDLRASPERCPECGAAAAEPVVGGVLS